MLFKPPFLLTINAHTLIIVYYYRTTICQFVILSFTESLLLTFIFLRSGVCCQQQTVNLCEKSLKNILSFIQNPSQPTIWLSHRLALFWWMFRISKHKNQKKTVDQNKIANKDNNNYRGIKLNRVDKLVFCLTLV